MVIYAKNISSGQITPIDTDFVSSVEIQTANTLKVTMNNKMVYIVQSDEELLKKAPKQLALFDNITDRGEAKKIKGIKRAIDHANIKNAGTWSEKAYQTMKLFLSSKKTGYVFMTEDVRFWAEEHNLLPVPPSKRAWGGIVQKLVREGIIVKAGHSTVKNENAHKCFATMWSKK